MLTPPSLEELHDLPQFTLYLHMRVRGAIELGGGSRH
jgi:hypothetical protein